MSDDSAGRLGIAIGPTEMRGVRLTRFGRADVETRLWTSELVDTTSRSLRDAFEQLAEAWGLDGPEVSVSLLPPLVRVRRIELPRLRIDEVRRVVERSASRYFFGIRLPHVVDARLLSSPTRSPIHVFATAAESRLLDALFEAADSVGWKLGTVSSAYDAWAAAVVDRTERGTPKTEWILLPGDDHVEGVRLARGRPSEVRRSPGQSWSTAITHWVEPGGESRSPAGPTDAVVLVGEGTDVDTEEGQGRAGTAARASTRLERTAPATLAAMYAGRVPPTELAPTEVRVRRRAGARRRVLSLVATAAALLVIAGGVESWGAGRELHAVRTERAAVADAVQAAMEERDILLGLTDRLGMLASIEASSPNWPEAVARITEHLPDDAYLVGFEARADTVVLEGLADRAAGVFDAMQAAPSVLAVRAQAPIRREQRGGGVAIERFTLSATLRASHDDGGSR